MTSDTTTSRLLPLSDPCLLAVMQRCAHELPLTRLEISECRLLDGDYGLAAGLMRLRDLEHLSANDMLDEARYCLDFPTDVLPHLQKLTCLSLEGVVCYNRNSSSNPSAALQPLQALSRLVDLQLGAPLSQHISGCLPAYGVTVDTLSGTDQLTRLALSGQLLEPRALADKAQLQHLNPWLCGIVPGAGVAQLLSELQHRTQLTHLGLSNSCRWFADAGGVSPLAPAAYASLTASSKLQHLDFSGNTLPSAAWQYMCPPSRTLPHLRYLDISHVQEADGTQAAPDTSAVVSCCPGLQSLKSSMPCSTAQLAPLQRLTGLHTLAVGAGDNDDCEGVQALCQLTGLQKLELWSQTAAEARILQLTQLKQLTALMLSRGGAYETLSCDSQDPASRGLRSQPVWRQLLRQLLYSHDPEVAQQAAAALK